jgi:predicted RNA binding protein YcfA (HicA-like mRNA interferase family)
MPPFGPIKRKDLVRYFAKLGFEGPYSGGKHQFMIKGHVTIRIPNPHKTDIGKELLRRILHQTGISRDVWEEL